MTVLDDSPRTAYTPRLHRRHEIVTTGGMDGVLRIGAALAGFGFPVRDFAADVREGVRYSCVTCTVSLTGAESDAFAERMRAIPSVTSVEAC